MRKKEKLIGSIIIIVIFSVFLLFGYINMQRSNNSGEDIFVEKGAEDKGMISIGDNKFIKVQIKGEVKQPGVYSLASGSRVEDLISIAGSFTDKADIDKVVSQAKKLRDEECIIVPKKVEALNISQASNGNTTNLNQGSISQSIDEKINVNTASKEELMKVPGIGDITANNIIQYREKNGDFMSMEDLKKVGRIGDKTLEKFKEKLEVR